MSQRNRIGDIHHTELLKHTKLRQLQQISCIFAGNMQSICVRDAEQETGLYKFSRFICLKIRPVVIVNCHLIKSVEFVLAKGKKLICPYTLNII